MTLLRDPLCPTYALGDAIAALGWADALAIAGVAEKTLRRWSHPDFGHRLTLGTASRLDIAALAAGAPLPPFEAWFVTRRELAAARARHALAQAGHAGCVATAARESGEAIAAVLEAALPGASHEARRRAAQETREAVGALGHLLFDCGGGNG